MRSRWFTIRAALKDLEAPHPYALALVKGEAPPAQAGGAFGGERSFSGLFFLLG